MSASVGRHVADGSGANPWRKPSTDLAQIGGSGRIFPRSWAWALGNPGHPGCGAAYRGGVTVLDDQQIHGTCHHDCPDSCGWTATVREATAVRLRGRADHPYSAGELCPKVNRFLDRVYAPDRILTPLRRVGPKGSGAFAPISWDDALAEIAERLDDVIERHGAEAVLPYSSAGNQSLLACQGLSSRFFYRLGASLLDRGLCGPTVGAGVTMTNGTGLGARPAGAAPQPPDHPVGHQHPADQPASVADDRGGPSRRRPDRRDRPGAHDHRRVRRPAHPAAAPAPTSR